MAAKNISKTIIKLRRTSLRRPGLQRLHRVSQLLNIIALNLHISSALSRLLLPALMAVKKFIHKNIFFLLRDIFLR
jgi:hypothetical protein